MERIEGSFDDKARFTAWVGPTWAPVRDLSEVSDHDRAQFMSRTAAEPAKRLIVLKEKRRLKARHILGDAEGLRGVWRFKTVIAIIWRAAVAVPQEIAGQCRSSTPECREVLNRFAPTGHAAPQKADPV